MCPCRGQEIDREYSVDALQIFRTDINRNLWYSERRFPNQPRKGRTEEKNSNKNNVDYQRLRAD